MESWIVYLFKASLAFLFFYGSYQLFLRKETLFKTNRFYLLSSLVVALILPLINYQFTTQVEVVHVLMDPIIIGSNSLLDNVSQQYSWLSLLKSMYWAIATIVFIRLLVQIFQVARIILSAEKIERNGISLLVTQKNLTPFSFLNWMVIPKDSLESEQLDAIVKHEMVHIRQWHSVDILFLELLSIFFWFHPAIWAYKKSITGIHEFLADREVIQNGTDFHSYKSGLINQIFAISISGPVNPFNHSLIKNRIIMMTKKQSQKIAGIKLLVMLPLVSILLYSFSLNRNKTEPLSKVNSSIAELNNVLIDKTSEEGKDSVFDLVEKMPVYLDGGQTGLIQFISNELKYPKKYRKKGIQGKVFVNFVVNKEGKVQDVKVIKTKAFYYDKEGKEVEVEGPLFAEESIRVVKKLGDFSPGKQKGKKVKVAYNLPLNFKLD